MKFLPLSPAATPAAASVLITCCKCSRSLPYVNACALAWAYDPNGEAFRAYYCGECQQKEMQA